MLRPLLTANKNGHIIGVAEVVRVDKGRVFGIRGPQSDSAATFRASQHWPYCKTLQTDQGLVVLVEQLWVLLWF
ncbi:hypothetical protein E2C01_023739 [Portunus trituberculatus]|uniref:Uncharacterized protein n=1 Tax=Portunus trituberculatus TaxID=210409 RepID=A0A5B7EBY1_PORTR|nr:hypothetical protein [Portunus trituberculatus]